MITENELRIGNWLRNNKNNQTFPVTSIEFSWNYLIYFESIPHSLDECDPIQLTTEILEKCGFMIYSTQARHNSNKCFCLLIEEDGYFLENEEDMRIGISVKYLHQLQNLFFALTGTELSVTI